MDAENRPVPCSNRIGTQTFAPLYGFSEENVLVETARGIRAMGSDVIKLSLTPTLYGLDASLNALPYAEIVRQVPEYRTVFDLDFTHYILWVHDRGTRDALSLRMDPEDRAAVYREMYDLTRFLLTRYDRTGKVFLLGHWEGDWVLLGGTDTEQNPAPERVTGMIESLRTRQQAVEDARRATPHSNVYVGHYCEVNRPLDAKDKGMVRMTSHVLPHVRVDMVSYSAYDSLYTHRLAEALDYIEAHARVTGYFDGIFDKKVFVGEYDGYQDYIRHGNQPPERQADNAWEVIETAVAWGAPFVLYWEFYSNGDKVMPPEHGFWMIDRYGEKQPVYFLHKELLDQLALFRALCREALGREPAEEEIRRWIRGARGRSPEQLRREFRGLLKQ